MQHDQREPALSIPGNSVAISPEWFYAFMGGCSALVLASIGNWPFPAGISSQRMHRTFSLVVSRGLDCLVVPIGTVLRCLHHSSS